VAGHMEGSNHDEQLGVWMKWRFVVVVLVLLAITGLKAWREFEKDQPEPEPARAGTGSPQAPVR
jgi:hypothetical protein